MASFVVFRMLLFADNWGLWSTYLQSASQVFHSRRGIDAYFNVRKSLVVFLWQCQECEIFQIWIIFLNYFLDVKFECIYVSSYWNLCLFGCGLHSMKIYVCLTSNFVTFYVVANILSCSGNAHLTEEPESLFSFQVIKQLFRFWKPYGPIQNHITIL